MISQELQISPHRVPFQRGSAAFFDPLFEPWKRWSKKADGTHGAQKNLFDRSDGSALPFFVMLNGVTVA